MSKYIVKNCPNLTTSYYAEGDIIHNQCGLTDDDSLCKDCTDCVLKQIAEKCKKEITTYRNTLLPAVGTNTLHFGRQSFAYDILQLLDIQEVE